MSDVGLPPGFQLDEPQQATPGDDLPPGYRLDEPAGGGNPFDQFDAPPKGRSRGQALSAIDISDLPTPGADISDLPVPPQSRGWGQALGEEGMAALHGAQREAMGLGNIADKVPQALGIPYGITGTSSQDLKAFDQTHAAEFANNKLGKFAGQALPLALAQLIPGLDVGADAGMGAQLASVGANAALGGLGSAATADPNHQLSAGLEGAALGGGLAGAGQLARVGLTPEAQRLSQYVEDATGSKPFIPIAAGGTGPTAGLYRHVLPNALGVSDQYGTQMRGLLADVRDAAAARAAPEGVVSGANPLEQAAAIKGQFNRAYSDLLDRWEPPQGLSAGQFGSDALDNIMQRVPNMDADKALSIAQRAQSMMQGRLPPAGSAAAPTGKGIQGLWNDVGDAVSSSDKETKAAWLAVKDTLDDVRRAGLSPDDQQALDALNSQYAESVPFQKGAKAAKVSSGNFSVDQFGRPAGMGTDALQAAQDLKVLKQTGAALNTPVGRYLHGSLAGYFAAAHPAGAAAAVALPLTLGSKTFQQGLQNGITRQALLRSLPLSVGALDASGQ